MTSISTIGNVIRQTLPARRETVTQTISFARRDGNTVSYDATIGFDPLGRPREIFLSGAKDGSDMHAALLDTAVALSVALQHGVTAAAMARSLCRTETGEAVSIVGAALDLLAQYEASP